MTVASTTNRSGPYDCDGSTTTFKRDFLIYDEDDLRVIQIIDDEETDLTSGFTQTGIGETSGTVVFTDAPTEGEILLLRDTAVTQDTDYSNQGTVEPEQIEEDLDRVVMQNQDKTEELGRAVKLKASSDLSDITMEDPEEGYAMIGDGDGNLVVGPSASEISSAESYAESAKTSATTATGAATTATEQAELAEKYADSLDADQMLHVDNNLSDLADAETARDNLGLGDAATADTVDEDDMASDSDTLLPTQQSVKAYVDSLFASCPFTTAVTSEQVNLADYPEGTGYTYEHGQGVAPDMMVLKLICTTTNLDYAVGDVVYFQQAESNNSDSNGLVGWANATYMGFGQATSVLLVEEDGGVGNINYNDWDVQLVGYWS